ncbi:MAG: hypothetical protein CFE33_18395 [Pseudorhodobacter sp. PARRP1]|nr:MAG: hypothetical protein CFE33_18395 [Pseudorhodobacter sp. PARRP1]
MRSRRLILKAIQDRIARAFEGDAVATHRTFWNQREIAKKKVPTKAATKRAMAWIRVTAIFPRAAFMPAIR